jgi:co-chaperonin GroES (HSP10)
MKPRYSDRYEALPRHIIVSPDEERLSTESGIILEIDKDMTIFGTVISSGMDGVKEGDRVIYVKYSGKHSGRVDKHMVTVNESTVLATIEKESV